MKQWLLLSCIFAYWAANASDAPFAIIENGVSKGKIVIPAKARNVEEKAAAELKEYLVKSTGVTLPIVRENAVKAPVKGFYLGRTQAALQTGLDMEKEAPDAFLIRYSGGKLFITGHDGSGKDFLEGTPGSHGHGSRKRLSVPSHRGQRALPPDILGRGSLYL